MKRVLVTGPVDRLADYAQAARSAGWEAIEAPLLQIEARSFRPSDVARPRYDWICITSASALPWLEVALAAVASLRATPCAVVGERTAERVRALGLAVGLPAAPDAAALAVALRSHSRSDVRILWPRGSLSEDLARCLRERGFEVEDPVAYDTRPLESVGKLSRRVRPSSSPAPPRSAPGTNAPPGTIRRSRSRSDAARSTRCSRRHRRASSIRSPFRNRRQKPWVRSSRISIPKKPHELLPDLRHGSGHGPADDSGPGEEPPPLPPEYLVQRPRRLRSHPALRRLVRETQVTRDDLVLPLFVVEGKGVRQAVPSMPGVFRESIDRLSETCREAEQLGIPAVILFGIPDKKDPEGRLAWSPEGIVQRALERLATPAPSLLRIADLCFCEYTDHGHCGVLTPEGDVDNDATLENLELQTVALADAGAQVIAPSGMMDGQVGSIRAALDESAHLSVAVLSYAAKYASGFYGPFRDAADSAPAFGDRNTYQMDPANSDEAIREVELDLKQGADMIMVKPAMPCLDIVRRVRERFDVPLCAYQVSGEYAMIKAAAAKKWIDEPRVMVESLTCIKRAGADFILTYYAREMAKLLK